MATGDWSFPRAGCSCIRFKTQIAKRPWIGCLLSPYIVPGYGLDTTPRRCFLNVLQEWSATPIFAARNFSAAWDITKENYGRITATGGNPQSSIGYLFPLSGTITAPEELYPYISTRGTGAYVFSRTFDNPTNGFRGPLQLVSFAAASSTSITLTETMKIRWGGLSGPTAPATLRRTWSNEFTPAKMDGRLREDLELEVPYSTAHVDVPYPNNLVDNSVIPNIGENRKPWERGGMAEFEDNNFAIGIYSTAPEGIDPGDVLRGTYGHSHSWQSRLLSQGSFPGPFGTLLFPASLSRCKIYQPGAHRFESKSLLDGSPTAFCQNLPVSCPPDSANGDALYILEPPEKDLEKKELYLNSQCP